MLHICISESGQHWFRLWLGAEYAPSHYLKTNAGLLSIGPSGTNSSEIRIEIQNFLVFIHENASENIVCEMSAILSRGRWVDRFTCYMYWDHVIGASHQRMQCLSMLMWLLLFLKALSQEGEDFLRKHCNMGMVEGDFRSPGFRSPGIGYFYLFIFDWAISVQILCELNWVSRPAKCYWISVFC